MSPTWSKNSVRRCPRRTRIPRSRERSASVTQPTVAALIAGALLASGVPAQGRPDFSGRWTSEPPAAVPSARDAAAERARPADRTVDLGSGWGRTITIAQNDRALTVEWPFFSTYDLQPPLRFV